MKKVLVLNLPYPERITRRYMCSYTSPESLFPPLELISIAAIGRDWKNADVTLVDAIAMEYSFDETLSQIKNYQPDMIITLTGLDCIEEDCATIKRLKATTKNAIWVIFGHYTKEFPKEVLTASTADYAILGEPELIFSDLYDALYTTKKALNDVNGIVYSSNGKLIQNGTDNRIPDPNVIPMPAYNLLPKDKYFEPMLKRPFSMIQTARGCPYPCTYCVKSYGSKLTILSPERVVEEIIYLKQLHNIKSLRFIDDTFTINKKRVIEICKLLVEKDVQIEWACLSRTDNLTEEVLYWMKKSGCKRIYFGLESGSQRILDLYRKKVNVKEAKESLLLVRKHGIETSGFFMSGYPQETEEDFIQTVQFAIDSKLTFASFNPLTPYPGTAIFNELKMDLNFSILPYKNEFIDSSLAENFTRRKKIFYKKFYLRPNYILINFKSLIMNFRELYNYTSSMINYLFFKGGFAISGIKGPKDK